MYPNYSVGRRVHACFSTFAIWIVRLSNFGSRDLAALDAARRRVD